MAVFVFRTTLEQAAYFSYIGYKVHALNVK
jgi:hypothetical protein